MSNNKLIAEFMGWKRGKNEETNVNQFFLAQPDHWYLKDENELAFHNSWDWLMPVIIKISSLTEDGVKIEDCETIQSAYRFVVEFIKAHNKYPFNEGDDYWVLEDGELVWGVWDDASEDMHDENPDRKYFTNEQAMEFAKTWGIKYNK